MENITLSQVWAVVSGIAAAIFLLAQAGEKIVAAVKAAKAPNKTQNDRLDALETDMKEVKAYLAADRQHLDALDNGNRITQRALLALLAHGIDGNNVEQMEKAKIALEEHLINR